jgi:hypothetical protein
MIYNRLNDFVVYEKHPHADAYRVHGFFEPYALNARNKRLTDSELAAEYWAAALDADLMAPADLVAITATIRRFATLPHYDSDES